MRVRLLGPVDVLVDGEPRPVRGRRRTAILVALAVNPGTAVSTGRLIDLAWSGEPQPEGALATLQSHISHLRRLLGAKRVIVARAPGYQLELGPDGTDIEVVQRLLEQARSADDPAYRVDRLRAAAALWRGRALGDVADLPGLDHEAERLDQLRVAVAKELVTARLALGQHAQLVPEIEELALADPFDEEIHAQLILALYRSGRQADALAAYQRLREGLRDDLGIDPNPSLRELAAAILRQDPILDDPVLDDPVLDQAPVKLTAVAATTLVVPAQLPLLPAGFTGRDSELAELDKLLDLGQPGGAGVAIISGAPGVGKTTLAVRWASAAASRFPDGQLFVNLRGFDRAGSATDPAQVINGFLQALGAGPGIPPDVDAQVALYRSLLVGRRVLVVLDNARDSEQVRPLLPGSSTCFVVVTSRDQLTGLVAAEAAHPLTLELLGARDAYALLVHRLGAERVAAESEAVHEILDRCAGLTLALALVAARALTRAHVSLTRIAAELRDAGTALDAFDIGESATDLRAVFRWSYRALKPATASTFRYLGRHPGPEFTLESVASLVGTPANRVRAHLAELVRGHLISEQAPGRYVLHDLLRAYASELSDREESAGDRRAATRRLLDHYLHAAYQAALLLDPNREPIAIEPAGPGTVVRGHADAQYATAWFGQEHAVLVRMVDLAYAEDELRHAWQLPWTLVTYLQRRGHWHDWAATQAIGLAAVKSLGAPGAAARAHRGLGVAYAQLGRLDDANEHYRAALDLYESTADLPGQAQTRLNLAWVADRQRHQEVALDHAQRAWEAYRALGDDVHTARALNTVGWHHALLGRYEEALDLCTQAVNRLRVLGDQEGEAWTCDSLGYANRHLGRYDESRRWYTRSLELLRRFDDRYSEAEVLDHLAHVHRAAGDMAAAREAWQRAFAILDELAHPDRDRIRARLAALRAGRIWRCSPGHASNRGTL